MSMALSASPIGVWLHGTIPKPDVGLDEFFPPDFMREHTRFDRFAEFRSASPRDFRDRSDIEPVRDEDLDRFVDSATRFESWRGLVNAAAERELRDRYLV